MDLFYFVQLVLISFDAHLNAEFYDFFVLNFGERCGYPDMCIEFVGKQELAST